MTDICKLCANTHYILRCSPKLVVNPTHSLFSGIESASLYGCNYSLSLIFIQNAIFSKQVIPHFCILCAIFEYSYSIKPH